MFIPSSKDPARRYYLVSKYYDENARRNKLSKGGGWYGSFSADGIHWTAAEQQPLFRDRSDVAKFCFDQDRREFFGTPKIWTDVRGHLRRCVGTSSSGRFDRPWPAAQLMLVPDAADDRWATRPGQHTQFYGLSAFAYETMYLGLLEVFRVTDSINDGPIQIELVTSRDRIHWDRMPDDRAPILPVGPAGAWDGGMIKTPNHPIVEGESIKLFYGGGNRTHGFGRSYHATRGRAAERSSGTGLATLRKDGFASLDAGVETGSVTTVPLAGASGRLRVNYRAAPGGWIKVELLDAEGAPIEGYGRDQCLTLAGNEVCAAVRWKYREQLPECNRTLRLRFLIHNASLFSFDAGPGARAEVRRAPLGVLYSFEDPHSGDALASDGAQDVYFRGEVRRALEGAKAAFGQGCVEFHGDRAEPWDTLEIDGSFRLSSHFTLAAFVKPARGKRMRLFSSFEPYPTRVNEPPYERQGEFGRFELIFDFVASDNAHKGELRLVVQGHEVAVPATIKPGTYHHLAATYDDGAVRLYLDGRTIAAGHSAGGEVNLLANLRLGADCGPFSNYARGPTGDKQFIGTIDDILVLGSAVGPDRMRVLSAAGGAAFFERPATR
jgi:hypothetical protein